MALLPGGVWAQRTSGSDTWVDGGVVLSYAQFEAEQTGRDDESLSHLFQQYSLLFNHSRDLINKRFGHLDLALGGEWNILNAEAIDGDRDLSLAKPLYRFKLELAPQAMPFSLTVDIEDLQRSSPSRDRASLFPKMGLASRGKTFELIDDVSNGTFRRSSFTLLVGGQVGQVGAAYEDFLRSAPDLYVEYSEILRDNTKAILKQKYRLRDLAFVSLNKRDNWLHYEVQEFTDYLDSKNNYNSNRVLLGTVDLYKRRRWINLTNWLQLSADVGLETYSSGERLGPRERFDVNLFVQAHRTDYELSVWPTFQRTHDVNESLEKAAEVPVYGKGDLGRDDHWGLTYYGDFYEKDDFVTSRLDAYRMHYANASYDHGSDAGGQWRTRLEYGGGNDSDEGESQAFRLREEWQKKGRDRDLLVGLSGATFFSEPQPDSASLDNFTEWAADFNLSTRAGAWQYGGGLAAVLGSGTYYNGINRVTPLSEQQRIGDDRDPNLKSVSDTSRVTTSLFGEHVSGFWRNRYELEVEWDDEAGKSTTQTVLGHRLDYSTRTWGAHSVTRLTLGSHDLATQSGLGSSSSTQFVTARESFSNSSRISYAPSPMLEVSGGLRYEWQGLEAGGSENLWALREKLQYRVFNKAVIKRLLFKLTQDFEISEASALTAAGQMEAQWSLEARYYPRAYANLGLTYEGLKTDKDDFLGSRYTFDTEFDFRLLTLVLHTMYGTYDLNDGVVSKRTEYQWGVDVRRLF